MDSERFFEEHPDMQDVAQNLARVLEQQRLQNEAQSQRQILSQYGLEAIEINHVELRDGTKELDFPILSYESDSPVGRLVKAMEDGTISKLDFYRATQDMLFGRFEANWPDYL